MAALRIYIKIVSDASDDDDQRPLPFIAPLDKEVSANLAGFEKNSWMHVVRCTFALFGFPRRSKLKQICMSCLGTTKASMTNTFSSPFFCLE